MSQPAEPPLPTINDEAITAVCAKYLHQTLYLPANDSQGKLRVTFATTSNFDDTSLPVILFVSPMFAGRMPALSCSHTAKEIGVRIICVDRPGFGGSTAVPVEARINVWLETVPVLLRRLNVKWIDGLVCHSAGTLYVLNTIYHLRDWLSPKRPYVGLMGPWVHYDHSDATLMNLASKFPKGMVGGFHTLNKFIATKIAPTISWSGGIFSSVADLFQASPISELSTADEEDTAAEKYGTSEEIASAIEKLSAKYFFAEDTSAASEDAKLCLKKCEPGSWGACEDYKEFVQNFTAMEKERRLKEGEQAGENIKIEAYFAESDIMIGKAGQAYFEECWRQQGVEEVVEFVSIELKDTNHETVITSLKKGAMRLIFKEVARRAKS